MNHIESIQYVNKTKIINIIDRYIKKIFNLINKVINFC